MMATERVAETPKVIGATVFTPTPHSKSELTKICPPSKGYAGTQRLNSNKEMLMMMACLFPGDTGVREGGGCETVE
jgi:hypothetical protein